MDFSQEQVLYGLDKGGSYKFWSVKASGSDIIVRHGKDGGAITEKATTAKPKNIGKANHTSTEQQALLEAESKYKKQIDKGYRASKDDLNELPFLPMLASDYLKVPHKVKYPVYVQPKLDGVRCSVFLNENGDVVLRSRGGKDYDISNTRLFPALQLLFKTLVGAEDLILDGELYAHGFSLEQIVSAVKRVDASDVADKTKDEDDILIAELREYIEFHMFDVYDKNNPNLAFKNRIDTLVEVSRLTFDLGVDYYIVMVYHEVVHSEEHLDVVIREYVDNLYEGVIIRNMDGVYEVGKRSGNLLKYKLFHDDEFEIVGVEVDKDGHGVFQCYCPLANATFGCTLGSHSERKDQAENPEKYIGKYLTVKYQTRYKDTQLPQFPTGLRFRDVIDGSVDD